MTNSKKIKDFFSNIKKRRMSKARNGFNVSVVWKRIFLLFVVVNIIVIAVSVYLFFQINSGGIFRVEQDTVISVDSINRALLRDTIDSFEQKKLEFERLKTKESSVVDPSL
jgi:hypothetical protein